MHYDAYGRTVKAIHLATCTKRTVRILDKKLLGWLQEQNPTFMSQLETLKALDHPNALKVIEYFEDKCNFYIVSEAYFGSDIFDYLAAQERLSEPLVARIMHQILSAVTFCHEKNIILKNIKPQNIILFDEPDTPDTVFVKLTDLSSANLVNIGESTNKMLGTAYYLAPEMLEQNVTEKCDVWSCGVMLYLMIWGSPPFNGKNDSVILDKIRSSEVIYEGEDWVDKPVVKELVQQMLTKNPNRRVSARDALNHPWIQQNLTTDIDKNRIQESLGKLKGFRAGLMLQRAVLLYITSQIMENDHIKELKDSFNSLDTSGDGKLDKDELKQAYRAVKGQTSEEEIDRILESVDVDGRGYIDYSEFILAHSNKKKALSKWHLKEAFQAFDKDGSGMISLEELKNVLGDNANETWQAVMDEADSDGNGEIDIKEFKTLMLKNF